MRINEIAKVRLSTDPKDFGAYVTDKGTPEKTVILPILKLVAFEPEDKFKEPKYAKNLAKIIQALKAGKELPPILVRKHQGGYQVLDGHHRFMAYKLAGKREIPARIVAKSNVKDI
jgi:ParB-like chromosome segregation protein Spo0J